MLRINFQFIFAGYIFIDPDTMKHKSPVSKRGFSFFNWPQRQYCFRPGFCLLIEKLHLIFTKNKLMKRIFALLLLAGVVYLSSCGDGANDKLPAVIKPDSTSKGDTLIFNYTNAAGTTKNFLLIDYVINNSPHYEMYSSIVYSKSDSLWHLKIQLIDNKLKNMALNLNLVGPTQTGTYIFPNNSSTFINYSDKANTTYEVSNFGSTVDIIQATYPIRGTFALKLYRNFNVFHGTGSFKIYP